MRFTEEEIENLVSDYNDGMTPKELSIKYDRNSGTIIGKLKSLGVYKPTKHRFTKDEIEFIREHYPKGELDVIYERIPSLTKSNLITLCHNHGISADYYNDKKWTDEDLAIVEKCYYTHTLDEIRDMVGNRHTSNAIQTKALRCFGYSKDRTWYDDEIEILKTYYPIESVDDVCSRLPKRTRQAIIRKANNLGIQNKFYTDTYWSEDEEKFLVDNWKNMSDKELAEYFGRDVHAVVDKRSLLGLARIQNRDGKSYADLQAYIRGNLRAWKRESMASCDYKCVLTGSSDFQIHHLYSFSNIFDEVIEENGISLKDNFSEYTDEELTFILDKFIMKHNEYPLGVCVRKDLHSLFHSVYGKITTKDMWDRFVDRYNNNEFNSYKSV